MILFGGKKDLGVYTKIINISYFRIVGFRIVGMVI